MVIPAKGQASPQENAFSFGIVFSSLTQKSNIPPANHILGSWIFPMLFQETTYIWLLPSPVYDHLKNSLFCLRSEFSIAACELLFVTRQSCIIYMACYIVSRAYPKLTACWK